MNVIEQGTEADRPKSGLPLSSVFSPRFARGEQGVRVDAPSVSGSTLESLGVSFPATCCGSVIPAKAGIQSYW